MSTTTVKLHRSRTTGKWVPCHADQRPCPREHVVVSGEATEAAKFFAEVGLQEGRNGSAATKGESSELTRARLSFDSRTHRIPEDYLLPEGSGFDGKTQAQRYAMSVTNMALYVLADKAGREPFELATVNYGRLAQELNRQAKTFAGSSAGDERATQTSLTRILELLKKHSHTEVNYPYGRPEETREVEIRPAMMALEEKLLTVDLIDPDPEPKVDRSYGVEWAADAKASFGERSVNLDYYDLPPGMSRVSSLARSHNQRAAQDVTLDAVGLLLSSRSPESDDYADFREVRRRLNSHFAELQVTDDATYVSLERTEAILKREASVQNLGSGTVPYVDVKAALRALEDKAFTADLHEPVPAIGAQRDRAELNAQQREGVRALRQARRGK